MNKAHVLVKSSAENRLNNVFLDQLENFVKYPVYINVYQLHLMT